MPFDVQGAISEGYTRSEIADYLAQQNNFDINSARSEGYSDDEIFDYLTNQTVETPEPEAPSYTDALGSMVSQAGEILADHFSPMDALSKGQEDLNTRLSITGNALSGDIGSLAQSIASNNQWQIDNPAPDYIQEFHHDLADDKDGWETVGTLWDNPKALGRTIIEQLPQMEVIAPGMAAGTALGSAAGPVGAFVGGWQGSALPVTAIEFGANVQQDINEWIANNGLDSTNPAHIKQAIEDTGTLEKNALPSAVKGQIIGLIDRLGLSAAHRVKIGKAGRELEKALKAEAAARGIKPSEAAKLADVRAALQPLMKSVDEAGGQLLRTTGAIGVGGTAEGSGEYLGQGLGFDEWNSSEAVLEAAAGIGMEAGQVAMSGTLTGNNDAGRLEPQPEITIDDYRDALGSLKIQPGEVAPPEPAEVAPTYENNESADEILANELALSDSLDADELLGGVEPPAVQEVGPQFTGLLGGYGPESVEIMPPQAEEVEQLKPQFVPVPGVEEVRASEMAGWGLKEAQRQAELREIDLTDSAGKTLTKKQLIDQIEDYQKGVDLQPVQGELKDPELTMPKKPVQQWIRSLGGVDPDSPLAGELRALDIKIPGVLRKGGNRSLDGIPQDEYELFDALPPPVDVNGYIDEQTIVDLVQEEQAGNPLRTQAQLQEIERYQQEMLAQQQQDADADMASQASEYADLAEMELDRAEYDVDWNDLNRITADLYQRAAQHDEEAADRLMFDSEMNPVEIQNQLQGIITLFEDNENANVGRGSEDSTVTDGVGPEVQEEASGETELVQEEELLTGYTEEDIRQREEAEQQRLQAEADENSRSIADSQVDSFELTGSDLPADSTPGQGDLLSGSVSREKLIDEDTQKIIDGVSQVVTKNYTEKGGPVAKQVSDIEDLIRVATTVAPYKSFDEAVDEARKKDHFATDVYLDLFEQVKEKTTRSESDAGQAPQDYEARYQDRIDRINSAATSKEVDAIVQEEYQDDERHFEGTRQVERASSNAADKISNQEAIEAEQEKLDSGEWVTDTFDFGGSRKQTQDEVDRLNRESSDFEYRSVSNMSDGYAIQKRKKPIQQDRSTDLDQFEQAKEKIATSESDAPQDYGERNKDRIARINAATTQDEVDKIFIDEEMEDAERTFEGTEAVGNAVRAATQRFVDSTNVDKKQKSLDSGEWVEEQAVISGSQRHAEHIAKNRNEKDGQGFEYRAVRKQGPHGVNYALEKRKKPTLDDAAQEAATSTKNNLPEPTQAQKEAGNYKVGKARLHGLDISIENPKGSTRKGTDQDGKSWEVEMKHHYGYIRGTVGKDKDHVDVFMSGRAEDESLPIFVVDQKDPSTGKFDEHKVIMGAATEDQAAAIYLDNYEDGWQGIDSIREFTSEEFKVWVKDPKMTRKKSTLKKYKGTPSSEYSLLDARNDLIQMKTELESQGMVSDGRLANRIRRQERLIKEMETEQAPPSEGSSDLEARLASKVYKTERAAKQQRSRRYVPSNLYEVLPYKDGYAIFKKDGSEDGFAEVEQTIKDVLGKRENVAADSDGPIIEVEEQEKLDAQTETESSAVDQPGRDALEDAPAQEVRGTGAEGDAGAGVEGRSGTDSGRAGQSGGVQRGPDGLSDGVGAGEGDVAVSSGGGERGRGSERGQSGDSESDGSVRGSQRGNEGGVASTNYRITDKDDLGSGGAKTKFKDNVAAIRLLQELQSEGRKPSSEEQAVLVRYVGWGGLPQAFDSANDKWSGEYGELKSLLSADEYAAARRSTQDAHYTSPAVIRGIYDAVGRLGFKGGRVLEPSSGIGNFIGLLPTGMRKSSVFGVELDPTTGKIAQYLYPKADIQAGMGFQEVSIPSGYFDLAVGNPPFGSQKVFDPNHKEISNFSIHNYFFAKSIDSLREGGVLAMVVSNSLMDKAGGKQREWINERAKLLGAIRLPNNAFKQNAGTEVTTDVIFLQKRHEGDTTGNDWGKVTKIPDPAGGDPIPLNEYFAEHPEMMLGEMTREGSMYRENMTALVAPDGFDFESAFAAAVENLPENIYRDAVSRVEEVKASEVVVPDFAKVDGYFTDKSGGIHRRVTDEMGKKRSEKVDLKGKQADRVRGLVEVKERLHSLIAAEINPETQEGALRLKRAGLNAAYDKFKKNNGFIHEEGNRRIFRDDPDYPLLLSLESNYQPKITPARAKNLGVSPSPASADKAAIFDRRVIATQRHIDKAETAQDAMLVSLNETGRVDMERIVELYGKSEAEVATELEGLAFNDPSSGWVTADEYLSGNVKQKLAEAKNAANEDAAFLDNVEALEEVQPEDVDPVDISIRMNSPWIPGDVVDAFVAHLVGGKSEAKYVPAAGSWVIKISNVDPVKSKEWSSEGVGASYIIEKLMNNKAISVKMSVSDGQGGTKDVVDKEKTLAASAKADEIKQEFEDWVWDDKTRRDRLAKIYNDNFNTHVVSSFNGSHLTFPGKVPDEIIKLRPHQANGVWRMVRDGRGLLDHVVGAGKTFTMISAAMEQRRMGLMNKPMFVVPNHLIEQWAADFYKLYPNAKVLAATKKDFEKDNRRKLFARIATGDWDAVIVAHSSFGKIAVPSADEKALLEEWISDLEKAILSLSDDSNAKRTIKNLEKAKDRFKEKIEKAMDRGAKDDVVDFVQLGVDGIFLDEAHEFKNLFYATKRDRVAGLGNTQGSQKAMDLFIKSRVIQRRNNGRGVFFATGTPISNSIAEMFTMQRYMDYDNLSNNGLAHFDAWADTFANAVTSWELDATGVNFKLNTRFSQFVNMPELMSQYKTFADVVSLPDLKEMAKERGTRWPTPNIKGGKPENMVIERSEDQAEYMAKIVDRAENMPDDPREDNMLKVTNDARKAGLDMRLIDPTAEDYEGSKVNVSANRIFDIYENWSDKKGTQLVFIDLSTPKKKKGKKADTEILDLINLVKAGDEDAEIRLGKFSPDEIMAAQDSSDFSVYDDLKKKLIEKGIPENQVAFIHDANTDKQKAELFDRVNGGNVRVLIGSTAKMGAGMNVQKRLVALHHLDAPWRPSDLEQREGRIIRQGNMFFEEDPDGFEIEIIRYATEQTYDARMWQTIESKAGFIEQVRNGDTSVRAIEDISGEAANAAEMKAAASGNPLILEQVELDAEVKKLSTLEKAYKRKQHSTESDIDYMERNGGPKERLKKTKARINKEIKRRDSNSTKKFSVTIDGKLYDSRKKAGDVLIGKINTFLTTVKEGTRHAVMEDLVKYRGFSIDLEAAFRPGKLAVQALLQRDNGGQSIGTWINNEGLSGAGIFTRIDNALSGFESEIEYAEGSADTQIRDIEASKELLKKPFKDAERLEEARTRLAEVMRLLQSESEENTETVEQEQKFSLGGGIGFQGVGVPRKIVEKDADEFLSGLNLQKKIDVNIYDTPDDLVQSLNVNPEEARNAHGFIQGDRLHIIANALPSRKGTASLLRHEILAHYGLDQLEVQDKERILKKIASSRLNPFIREHWNEVSETYASKYNGQPMKIAEEVFARIAELDPGRKVSVWEKIIDMVVKALRKVGLIGDTYTRTEVEEMLRSIAKGIHAGDMKSTDIKAMKPSLLDDIAVAQQDMIGAIEASLTGVCKR